MTDILSHRFIAAAIVFNVLFFQWAMPKLLQIDKEEHKDLSAGETIIILLLCFLLAFVARI